MPRAIKLGKGLEYGTNASFMHVSVTEIEHAELDILCFKRVLDLLTVDVDYAVFTPPSPAL